MLTMICRLGPLWGSPEVVLKLCELKEEVGINSIVLAATDEALVKEAKAGDATRPIGS